MCLLVIIGAASPRLALILTWIFSDRISHAITSNLLAFAGFLFMPFTTFFYVLAWAPLTHVSGLGWLLVGFGIVFDLANYGGGGAYAKRRGSARA